MKAAGKTYEPVVYEGAGHGFMRAGEDPGNTNPANKTAREQAFARLIKSLKEIKSAHAVTFTQSPETASQESATQPACHDAQTKTAL
jgi:carboxymethylenebutenolidase